MLWVIAIVVCAFRIAILTGQIAQGDVVLRQIAEDRRRWEAANKRASIGP